MRDLKGRIGSVASSEKNNRCDEDDFIGQDA